MTNKEYSSDALKGLLKNAFSQMRKHIKNSADSINRNTTLSQSPEESSENGQTENPENNDEKT